MDGEACCCTPGGALPRGDDSLDISGLDTLLCVIDADSPLKPPPPPKRKLPRFGSAADDAPPLSLPTHVAKVYTRSLGEANALIEELHRQRQPRLIGLDIEWTVTFEANVTQRPASVLQIATLGTCYVLHLSAMREFPVALAALLEDARVIKTGCKIFNDALKLRRDYAVRTAGLLPLEKLAVRVVSERPWSLNELSEHALGRRLRKGDVRMSHWEAASLSSEQVEYASLDAWASRAVSMVLLKRLPPPPPRVPAEGAASAAAATASGGTATDVPSSTGRVDEEVLLRAAAHASLLEDTPADPMACRRHPYAPAALGPSLPRGGFSGSRGEDRVLDVPAVLHRET